jgi:hypothetical protein
VTVPGRVVLHIGFEKTGTKSIQYWLRDHESQLAEVGARFPRGWLRLNCHQEFPLALMRLDRLCSPREQGDEWRDADWRTDVCWQISNDLSSHRDEITVYSSENLDLLRYDDEFASLRALVGDAEIVAYVRQPDRWLAALRSQYEHKNGQERTLSSDPDAYDYLAPDSWRLDYDRLLAGWADWFSKVTVIDYDAVTERDGSVIPSFLRLLGWPGLGLGAYHLNSRNEITPRTEGNRFTNGLCFGEAPMTVACSSEARSH